MFGVLNVYKPKGLTSHDVVGVIRKVLKIKQVGHTGTLDPFAQGVLPICIGKATRLIEYFDDNKEYLATVQFGRSTDTYDIDGKIVQTSDRKITLDELQSGLLMFSGEILQMPPMYSAIKVNGKKLYEYARNGEQVKVEPRKVHINKIEVASFDKKNQVAEILIQCSKGTYIRSIANDLGMNLGCYAYLTDLIRTQVGKFNVKNSLNLPIIVNNSSMDIKNKYTILEGAKGIVNSAIQNPMEGLSLPIVEISLEERESVSHGNPIMRIFEKINSGDFLILVYNNNVDAIGQYDGEKVKIKRVFI